MTGKKQHMKQNILISSVSLHIRKFLSSIMQFYVVVSWCRTHYGFRRRSTTSVVATLLWCGAFTSTASYVSNICAFDGNLHFLIRKVSLTTKLQMLMGRARDKSLCQTHSNDFVMSSERKASEAGSQPRNKSKDVMLLGAFRTGRCTELIYSLELPADRYFFLAHKIYEKIESFATNFPYTLFVCKWNILSLKFMASEFPFSPVFMQYIICFRKNICT